MTTILVAGATGDLGERIVKALVLLQVSVKCVVRTTSSAPKIEALRQLGAEVHIAQDWTIAELTTACRGASCVVSALAGLRDVVVDAQTVLLDATIAAGVPRFIPSDYAIDFTRFTHGENRNLDWRREFHQYLDKQPIAATSIFNGAFMELLTEEMPMLLPKQKLLIYWGDGNSPWQFTIKDDVAAYTAHAAIDPTTPRYLHIAGDLISPKNMREVVNKVTGQKFKLLRIGGQGVLGLFTRLARTFAPAEKELYPAWQGMQYMHNMIDKRAAIASLDNDRYTNLRWTDVQAFLTASLHK